MAVRKRMAALGVAMVLLGTATACTPEPIVSIESLSQGPAEPALKVGTPAVPDGVDPKEGELLANIYAAALNAAGIEATVVPAPVKPGTILTSIESGSIDLIPSYSGLALSSDDSAADGAGDITDPLKPSRPDSVIQLEPAKAEVRDAVVVTAVTAEKYQLKSLSDIGKVCDQLVLGGSAEFKTKANGLPGLGSDYNCVPQKYTALQPMLDYGPDSTLWALLRDDIQLASMQISSPAIADNSLVVLDDPKRLFANQSIVPLAAAGKLSADVQGDVNKVSAALGTEQLGNLNRLALDGHHDAVADAATAWLVQEGLLKASS